MKLYSSKLSGWFNWLKPSFSWAVLFCFFMLASQQVFAGPGFEGEQQEVPVDGGLSILVAAGAALGAKKIQQARKKITKV